MEIKYAKIALMALQSFDNPSRELIQEKIQALNSKQPTGKRGLFRLRVGKFRVKCEHYGYAEETEQVLALHIIDIDSRGDIYAADAAEEHRDISGKMFDKIVRFWDKDFSKLTPKESRHMKIGRKQLAAGECYVESEIDWDNFDIMDLS